jgi:2,3-dihydroxybenzoate decarboxylase
MVKKIALEEHFLSPGFEDYWRTTAGDIEPQAYKQAVTRLSDFGDMRLEVMDRGGIARAVLGISGPGVQIERDTATAVRKASESNDFLAGEIAKRPDRYSGFAHLALQDAAAAADELERTMRDLGFLGAMINGHTNGQYLDHPSLYPFWERAEALGAVIYLHPADPAAAMPVLEGTEGLKRAGWEWGVETGSHALRLIYSGHFDRFPRATLALGHLGETLPYLLWRLDGRAKFYGVKLGRRPSDYIRDNIVVTISGMFSAEPLICAISALGPDRIMFATDYPFEPLDEASEFIDSVVLAEDVRADICSNNARRLLRLSDAATQ